MTERTVQLGMATYTDPDGVRRIGQAGEEVDVAADDLRRFDGLNGGPPEQDTPAPKKRPAKA